ncbi:MAG: winged helix DNA-binding domain-containing protein [Chloroflexi bacterium]|nr:winged helix DNA-binding domain-containing protein [Chloroflexota bacterium]
MRAQRLWRPDEDDVASPAQVLAEVCGVQAQDLPAALLSMRSRSSGFTAQDMRRARLEDRSILRTWTVRGTLHLISVEDYAWLRALLAPIFIAGDSRRALELGLDEETVAHGLQRLRQLLADRGPLTRQEIVTGLRAHGIPSDGQALPHLLYRASWEGLICEGPEQGSKPAYLLVSDWIKPQPALPQEQALAELARRYLRGYAPAAPADLAAWSGLSLREARRAWSLIAGELVQIETAGQPAWMLASQAAWIEESQPDWPIVKLLPRFDTYLLGYARRDLAIAPENFKRVNAGGGIIHATLCLDGRILGKWSTTRRKDGLELVIEPFEDLPGGIEPDLDRETSDIARFLGTSVVWKQAA